MHIIISVAATILIQRLAGVESWSFNHWLILICVPVIVIGIKEMLDS